MSVVNRLNRLYDVNKFDFCVNKMLDFFRKEKGFKQVSTQHYRSILAACEDPNTITTYNYDGIKWPLPQTGQMLLEEYLLQNPELPGVCCLSYSYRQEPNPVPGRHEKIFPMFEFESHGNMTDLQNMEEELLDYLGFDRQDNGHYPEGNYEDVAKEFGVADVEHEHEALLEEHYGPAYFLKNFPYHTSPFWNMKMNEETGLSNKIDVILHGAETIGSAERSTDTTQMREQFYTISDGQYKDVLFDNFTSDRVESELDKFLEYDFFPRYGGGIGVTRMMDAMGKSDLYT
jgi:aspartyl/asparaginyl-tRNA synthetase